MCWVYGDVTIAPRTLDAVISDRETGVEQEK